ncbi:MAG: F0F1 ATP synthase subunit A [Elusimicrobia bacterium]|nr:F0F1 ATP synthase subunit A [Elusimicrobiota bacterium]
MDLKHVLEHHILDEVWFRLPVFNGLMPWSKHLLMMLIAAAFLVLFLPLAVRGKLGILAKGFVEAIVVFIRDDILEPNLGHVGHAYLGYFCTLFFFILVCNLLGLVPYGATATGNIAVTLALAMTTFFLIHLAGIREHGLVKYLHSIVPAGVPFWLWPLLYPIELIGFATKAFALCIRLFANMIAGHIVILALLGLIFIFGALNPWVGLVVTAPVSILLVLFVMCLELFVAFLQAYIFTFLTAIFVGGAVHSH